MGLELLIFVAVLSAIGVGATVGNKLSKPTSHLVARRRLRAGPPELVDGAVVTLVGTVRAKDLLTAPLSQRPCVVLHVKTFIGPIWFTRFAMTEFVLETEHGEVIIEHFPNAGLALPVRRIHNPSFERAEHYLVGAGRSAWEVGRAVFDEIVVEPGMKISVYGVVRVDFAPPSMGVELGFRDTTRVLRLVGSTAHPLAIGTA
ncbi:MAG: hypothetical protein H0T79_15335 [Deltaproteobacteria bacterium]|nr:hypothetical protein [Deltaproteobacteria bacterium]